MVGFRPYAHIRNIYDRELVKPLEVYHKNGIITLFLPQKEVEKLPIGDWEVFVDLYCERIKKLTRLLTSRLELEF